MISRRVAGFLLVIMLSEVFLLGLVKIWEYDLWYHLKAGELVLNSGVINRLDPFSFSVDNRLWSVQSWLAGVIFYLVYSAGGLYALNILNAVVITLVFTFVFLTARLFRQGPNNFLLAFIIIMIAAFALRFRISLRPHTFEFLLLAITLYLLNSYRCKGKNLLFLIPIVQIIWVNTHASHILGLLLPLVFMTGEAAKFPLSGRFEKKAVSAYLIVFVANMFATLVNPVTYQAFTLPFVITGQELYMHNIDEWQPMEWAHVFGYGIRYTWGFIALLGLTLAGFALNRRKVEATDALLIIVFLVMALKGIRLMAEFAIVAAPIAVRYLQAPSGRFLNTRLAAAAMSVVTIFSVIPITAADSAYAFGFGIKKDVFPEKAVSFMERESIKGNGFNSFGFGDYLVWRLYPKQKVLIHGRNEVFPEEFYKRYLDAHTSPDVWKEVTGQYGIEYALLEYLTDLSGDEAVEHLVSNPEWALVYWDKVAIIYVKRTPRNDHIVEKWGYRHIRPARFDFSYLSHMKKEDLPKALSELDRLLSSSPENEEAYLARALIYYRLGRDYYAQAEKNLRGALELNPKQAMTYSALGIIYYDTKRTAEAKTAFGKALELDAADQAALAYMKRF